MRSNSVRLGLAAACLLAVACSVPEDQVMALSVSLKLNQRQLRADDTLTGRVTLRNKTMRTITVWFPTLAQTELLFFDETGNVAAAYRRPGRVTTSELRLGPFCWKDYPFEFELHRYAVAETLPPGTYRVRARPADHEEPYTEALLVLVP